MSGPSLRFGCDESKLGGPREDAPALVDPDRPYRNHRPFACPVREDGSAARDRGCDRDTRAGPAPKGSQAPGRTRSWSQRAGSKRSRGAAPVAGPGASDSSRPSSSGLTITTAPAGIATSPSCTAWVVIRPVSQVGGRTRRVSQTTLDDQLRAGSKRGCGLRMGREQDQQPGAGRDRDLDPRGQQGPGGRWVGTTQLGQGGLELVPTPGLEPAGPGPPARGTSPPDDRRQGVDPGQHQVADTSAPRVVEVREDCGDGGAGDRLPQEGHRVELDARAKPGRCRVQSRRQHAPAPRDRLGRDRGA